MGIATETQAFYTYQTAHVALVSTLAQFFDLIEHARGRRPKLQERHLSRELRARWLERDPLWLSPQGFFARANFDALLNAYPAESLALRPGELNQYQALVIEIDELLRRVDDERRYLDGRSRDGFSYEKLRQLVHALLTSTGQNRSIFRDRDAFFSFADTVVTGPRLRNQPAQATIHAFALVRFLCRERQSLALSDEMLYGFLAYTARHGSYAANQCEHLYFLDFFTDTLARVGNHVDDPFVAASYHVARTYRTKINSRGTQYPKDASYAGAAYDIASSTPVSRLVGSLVPYQPMLVSTASNEARWRGACLEDRLAFFSGKSLAEMLAHAIEVTEGEPHLAERKLRLCTIMGHAHLAAGNIDRALSYASQAGAPFKGNPDPPKHAMANRFRLIGHAHLAMDELLDAEAALRHAQKLYLDVNAAHTAAEIEIDLRQAGIA